MAQPGSEARLAEALKAEESAERQADARYWQPLKAEVGVGNDPYAYSPLRTPTLVFESVSFAGV